MASTLNLLQAETSPFADLSKIPLEAKEAKLAQWRQDPVLYFEERLGIPEFKPNGERNLDVHEVALLRALVVAIIQRKPVVVPSANAMGKDYTISGRATLWFFECWGPCKIIQTATGERQVLDIMWNELKSAYNSRPAADPMGKMVVGKLEVNEDWFLTAFTTKEQKDQPGKFHGIHAPRMMIVVSEAQGVEDVIFEQIEGMTMAGIVLPVYLGNPLTNVGTFARMIEDPVNNIVVRLDAYDCINVKEKRMVIPGLVTWEWVQDKEKRWNADGSGKDPRYMARVRGLLPTTSVNAVISKDLYRKCIGRDLSWWSGRYVTIGVDWAGTGADDMVVSVFESGELVDELVIPTCEAPEACAHVSVMQKKWAPDGGCVIVGDADGIGGPIMQFYRKMMPTNLPQGITLIEFHGSSTDQKVVDPQYWNTRAQAEFYAKERMMDGHIAMNDNPDCMEEATSTLWFVHRGKIQIEDKDDIKSRLSRSPNRWNARVMAIWGMQFAKRIEKKDGWKSSDRPSGVSAPSGGSAMAA